MFEDKKFQPQFFIPVSPAGDCRTAKNQHPGLSRESFQSKSEN